MPNWCKGELKVRGTRENIEKFLLEGLEPIGFSILEGKKERKIDKDEYSTTITSEGYAFWLKGTHRQFIESEEICFEHGGRDDKTVFVLGAFEGAWGIDSEGLAKLSKQFSIDFKIYGFERGMEFNQDVEVVGGEIVKDEEVKFDDYDWECVCPSMGG